MGGYIYSNYIHVCLVWFLSITHKSGELSAHKNKQRNSELLLNTHRNGAIKQVLPG